MLARRYVAKSRKAYLINGLVVGIVVAVGVIGVALVEVPVVRIILLAHHVQCLFDPMLRPPGALEVAQFVPRMEDWHAGCW